MTASLTCTNCGAELHPTGRGVRVRCAFCSTDNILDGATASQLAASGPVAPPEEMARFKSVLEGALKDHQALIEALHRRLTAALPGRVTSESHGGLLSRAKVIKVVADLGAGTTTRSRCSKGGSIASGFM